MSISLCARIMTLATCQLALRLSDSFRALKGKLRMSEDCTESIIANYEHCWASKAKRSTWKRGLAWQLPPNFQIVIFPACPTRKMWTYATVGMSQQGDAPALELHLFSPIENESHLELLTMVAHYHLTGAYLDVGHTLNFGRSWLPDSKCDHGLISLPYLDGPQLEWFEHGGQRLRFLWLIPITSAEVEYKKRNGLDALEARFETANFNYVDAKRSSVV